MGGRIRTVKPDFWTDSKVVQLSPYARLLSIGIWSFADDTGCIEDDPMQLKLQILPADPVDVESLIDELLKFDMIRRATASDGTPVLVVRRWEHQKISRPSQPRHGGREGLRYMSQESSVIPHGELSESSMSPQTCRSDSIHGGLSESSMLKGREGKGRDNPTTSSADADLAAVLSDPAPPRTHLPGKTYSWTLGTWAEAHDMPCPEDATDRAGQARWLLAVLHKRLRSDTDEERQTARGRAIAVLGDYLEATDKPLSAEAWSLLGRHVKGHKSDRVLDALEVAVNKGAGLMPEYVEDPLAVLKFAATVLNPKKAP